MIPTEKIPTQRIDGPNVVLLPYTSSLVPIYHSWMQSPELLTLTASEPLSLEQEYANQISWATDPTKYCFIVHSRRPVDTSFREGKGVQTALGVDYTLESEEQAEQMRREAEEAAEAAEEEEEQGQKDEDENEEQEQEQEREEQDELEHIGTEMANDKQEGTEAVAKATAVSATAGESTTVAPSSVSPVPSASSTSLSSSTSSSSPTPSLPYPLTPIGDVNLFLHTDFNLSDYGIHGGGAEIEIMIADSAYRGRGLGVESVKLIMRFSAEELGVERFMVKVLSDNTPSIKLFEEKLGFTLIEYVECFDECVFFLDTSVEREGRLLARTDEEGQQQQQQQQQAADTDGQMGRDMQQMQLHTHGEETTPPEKQKVLSDLD